MQTIFFNRRRLRAGWRLLLFLGLLFVLFGVLGAPLLSLFPGLEQAEAGKGMGKVSLFLDGYLLIPLLLASWLMARYIDRRPFASLGLPIGAAWGKEFLTGVLIGIAIGSLYLLGSSIAGSVRLAWGDAAWAELAILAAGFLLAAGFEEALFHGYPFQTLIEGIGPHPALLLVSVVFSLFHRANPNFTLIGSINVGLAGLLLGVGYLQTRALWLPIGIHLSWNFFQVLFSFPVSGLQFASGPISAEVEGPELLTGGPFGPEGSVIATIVFSMATAFLVLSGWIRPSGPMEKLWQEHIHPAFSGEGRT